VTRPFDTVLLAHGSGGRLTRELVETVFAPAFDNPALTALGDAAVLDELPAGRPALTTDGFVVDPPVFPGGDLGHLSICGTVNDLAMVGARPLWLTWALILEEGADAELIRTCTASAARTASAAGVAVVAGDTKVVPKGRGDRLYAVSTGLGVVPPGRQVTDRRIVPGDRILVSGPLGDHGATIMACRHDLVGDQLVSDCAPVHGLVEAMFEAGVDVHCLHDPTRGGALAVCHEAATRCGHRLVLEERTIPVRPQVHAVCEVLGLEPLGLACEGRLIAWVAADQADRAVEALRSSPGGEEAAIIGRVEVREGDRLPLIMETEVGSTRPLDLLSGTDLPRIC
jgi:hydrogenase expression/formation protein HypE